VFKGPPAARSRNLERSEYDLAPFFARNHFLGI